MYVCVMCYCIVDYIIIITITIINSLIQSHRLLGQILGLRYFIWCMAYAPVCVTLSTYKNLLLQGIYYSCMHLCKYSIRFCCISCCEQKL